MANKPSTTAKLVITVVTAFPVEGPNDRLPSVDLDRLGGGNGDRSSPAVDVAVEPSVRGLWTISIGRRACGDGAPARCVKRVELWTGCAAEARATPEVTLPRASARWPSHLVSAAAPVAESRIVTRIDFPKGGILALSFERELCNR